MSDKKEILSVSFGKFSCRLEGFDDPVETLKTIVGHFRDLAEDDRFIEAASQMPEMDQLTHQIAAEQGTDVRAASESDTLTLSAEPAPAPDAAPDVAPAEVAPPEEATATDTQPDDAPAKRSSLPQTDDSDMARIMTQADRHITDKAADPARNSMASLKAALAAEKDADTTDPLPVLVLEPSQRVYEDGPVVREPFAAYAQRHAATSVADLLLAATAYLAQVEGRAQFSRVQIMKKAGIVLTKDTQREERLQVFSALVDAGRITRLGSNVFAPAPDTPFRPLTAPA